MFEKNELTQSLANRIFLDDLNDCLKYPKYFQLSTINICNSRCIMCPVSMRPESEKKVIDEKLYEKFVNELKDYANFIESVCLNRDNEPTLDRDLPKRIKMLKDIGIKHTTISTNAQRLDEEYAKSLIEAGIDDLKITINAFTEETFKKITKSLNFNTIVSNTLKTIELRDKINPKMKIRLRMVIIEENKHEVNDWVAFWQKKLQKHDRAYAMPEHSWGNQTFEEEADKVEKYKDKACISPFSSFLIDVTGIVGLCAPDYCAKYIKGDFNTKTIKEIWNGAEFNHVRECHLNKKRNEVEICKGCDLWDREYVE